MAPQDRYRLPAEWEPHAATWIAWPHRRATFLGEFSVIPAFFARFVRLLAECEPVRVVASGSALAEARASLDGVADVELGAIPTNDSWLRDTGPMVLVPRSDARAAPPSRAAADRRLAVCWDWNAWGGKYPPWDLDARVARSVSARLAVDVVTPGLVLEGGAVDTDGESTLLGNERCVVDPRRNPGWTRDRWDAELRTRLAADRVVWIGGELAGDDTDGHVDQLARFVAPGRIVAARQPDRTDPNHASLAANLRLLEAAVDARGRRFEVIPIDIPSRFSFTGVQLPASHLNFYVLNGAVMVPVFAAETDSAAVRTLADCFPGRRIVPVDCQQLVRGRGALHCITRDEPAAPK
ncbi:MAG: agmatine/peptidylarginine deiminase [Planctomycetia bacterium]